MSSCDNQRSLCALSSGIDKELPAQAAESFQNEILEASRRFIVTMKPAARDAAIALANGGHSTELLRVFRAFFIEVVGAAERAAVQIAEGCVSKVDATAIYVISDGLLDRATYAVTVRDPMVTGRAQTLAIRSSARCKGKPSMEHGKIESVERDRALAVVSEMGEASFSAISAELGGSADRLRGVLAELVRSNALRTEPRTNRMGRSHHVYVLGKEVGEPTEPAARSNGSNSPGSAIDPEWG